MPLIYLLLLRAMHVLQHGQDVPLHPKELSNLVYSVWTVYSVIVSRVADIKGEFWHASQSLLLFILEILYSYVQTPKPHPEGAASKILTWNSAYDSLRLFYVEYLFARAQYYYVEFVDEAKSTEYWKKIFSNTETQLFDINGVSYLSNHFAVCDIFYDDLGLCAKDPANKLLYTPPDDSLHLEIYDEESDNTVQSLPSDESGTHLSTWSGFHVLKQPDESFTGKIPVGVLRLRFPESAESGPVTGLGIDYTGDFTVQGTVSGSDIVYTKRYTRQDGYTVRFQGTLNAERDSMDGVWGTSTTSTNVGDLVTPLDKEEILGRFEYRIAPVRFAFIEIDEAERAVSKPRALWKFAIKTVLNLVKIKGGHFSWAYLSDRRKMRKRFIELYSRFPDPTTWPYAESLPPLISEESGEFATLVVMLSEKDLRFYKNLCAVLRRRRVIHW